jgi:2-methylcitrate dehydratase PrpD
MHDHAPSFDRRTFLAATSALGLFAMNEPAPAQPATAGGKRGKPLRQILAEFVVGFDLKQVPPDVIAAARTAFIDTVGVAVAGSHEEVSHVVAEMVKLEGAAAQCTVIGTPLRVSPQLAALANGVSTHAMDYDASFLSGQSVAPVIPALLAIAELNGATPAEVLSAALIGAEVSSRIQRSSPRLSNGGGWHTTGIVGGLCAAAACARLMKLPVEQVANAIGIAASLAGGLPVNYGTMTKPLHCGNSARNGVMAAMLASKGFTSHAAAFEGNNGYFGSFSRALPVDTAPFQDLGRRWDIVEIGYRIKNYPCGGRGHTAIEAALMLREKIGGRVEDVTNIHCWMSPASAKRINTDYPPDVEAAKFSAAYVLAYSLLYGAPKIKAFTEEALKDERTRAVAKLVTAGADSKLSDAAGENPCRVRLTLKDGRTFELQRDHATGSKEVPMTPAQIEEKFIDCATQTVSADAARKLFAIVSIVGEQPSFGEFFLLMRKT